MPFPFLAALPAIVSAGATVASAFAKPKPQRTSLDLGALRAEADANGFNPLTVLRATGGSGFTTTQPPVLSDIGRIANAAGGVANAFGTISQLTGNASVTGPNPEPVLIPRSKPASLAASLSPAIPTPSTRQRNLEAAHSAFDRVEDLGTDHTLLRDVRNQEMADALIRGEAVQPLAQRPEVTNPYGSLRFQVNPWLPNVEAFEDHLGDIFGGAIGGFLVTGADSIYNYMHFGRPMFEAARKGVDEFVKVRPQPRTTGGKTRTTVQKPRRPQARPGIYRRE